MARQKWSSTGRHAARPPFRPGLSGYTEGKSRPSSKSSPRRARPGVKPPRPRVNRRDLLRLRGSSRRLRPWSDAGRPPAGPTQGVAQRSDLLRASRPAMGSYFEVRLGAGTPGAVDLAERALDLIDDARSTADGLPRRLRGQPAQRHGPPRAGRGRAGPVRAARAGRRDRRGDRRGLRRDGRGPLARLGLHPRAEAGSRRRDPGRRPGPDRPASPDRSTPSAGRSPSTGRGS